MYFREEIFNILSCLNYLNMLLKLSLISPSGIVSRILCHLELSSAETIASFAQLTQISVWLTSQTKSQPMDIYTLLGYLYDWTIVWFKHRKLKFEFSWDRKDLQMKLLRSASWCTPYGNFQTASSIGLSIKAYSFLHEYSALHLKRLILMYIHPSP